jgi:hypothetical protein
MKRFPDAEVYTSIAEPVRPDDLVRLGEMLSYISVASFGGHPGPLVTRAPAPTVWQLPEGVTIEVRADRSIERNWEALKELANY